MLTRIVRQVSRTFDLNLCTGGMYMEEKKTTVPTSEELKKQTPDTPESAGEHVLSETWAQDALQDLDDFIESQGIYIRQ